MTVDREVPAASRGKRTRQLGGEPLRGLAAKRLVGGIEAQVHDSSPLLVFARPRSPDAARILRPRRALGTLRYASAR